MSEAFAHHLGHHITYHKQPLISTTIDQYFSHVSDLLLIRRLVPWTDRWRNAIVAAYMKAYRRRDLLIRGAPRLHIKIDVSLTIVLPAIAIAHTLFGHQPPIVRDTVEASLLLGLGFGLRPGDYLYPHDPKYTSMNNCLEADQFAFIFPSCTEPVQITSPSLFPPNEKPVYMLLLPDFDKSHPSGD